MWGGASSALFTRKRTLTQEKLGSDPNWGDLGGISLCLWAFFALETKDRKIWEMTSATRALELLKKHARNQKKRVCDVKSPLQLRAANLAGNEHIT